jgi:2-keto-myo-inositol isomerase
VDGDLPLSAIRDAHRVLPTPKDRLGGRSQLEILEFRGYAGPISFEPFSPEIQTLSEDRLKAALVESMHFLGV